MRRGSSGCWREQGGTSGRARPWPFGAKTAVALHRALVTRNLGSHLTSEYSKLWVPLGDPLPGAAWSRRKWVARSPRTSLARSLRPPPPVPGPLEGSGRSGLPVAFRGGVPRPLRAAHPDGGLQGRTSPVGARARPAQVCEPRLPLGDFLHHLGLPGKQRLEGPS